MVNSMIKAITFDLDDTLINYIKFKKETTVAAAKAMSKAGFKRGAKKLNEELFEFYLEHGIEEGDVFQAFLRKHDQYSEKVLAAAINAYRKERAIHLKPYPGVVSTLKKLKKRGYKIGIVTDAPRLKAFIRLDLIGITDLFDVIVTAEDVGRRKPSSLPFKAALKELGVSPSEAMHVGDWPERDVLGAKRMGMVSCFAKYGSSKIGRKVWARHVIHKFEDLLELLEWGR